MLGTVRLLAMTLENALLARQPGWLVDLDPRVSGLPACCWEGGAAPGPTGPVGSGSASTPSTVSGCCASAAACGWCRRRGARRHAPLPSAVEEGSQAQRCRSRCWSGASHCSSRETGSGKEHLVRTLHARSSRRSGLWCASTAALPAGWWRPSCSAMWGAFSGARSQGSQGYLRAAHGGIPMLDEIGELPLQAQTRLLQVLQERVVTRWATTDPAVDFWLVSASHRDLAAMVAAGTFREDLYYRICGWRINNWHLRAWSVPSVRADPEPAHPDGPGAAS